MTRLTNDARGKIVNMILAHKFDPIFAALDKERTELGNAIWDRMMAVHAQAMANLQSATGGRALPTATSFVVNAAGWSVALTCDPRPFFHDQHSKIDRSSLHASYHLWVVPSEDPMCAKIQSYAERRKLASEEEGHLRDQIAGQVGGHYTFDKLSAAWPEIDAFVRAVERNLPAPQLAIALADHKALNEALDLPPAKAA